MSGGAGIGVALSRGPVCGDATAEPIMGASFRMPIPACLRGQIPEGPSSARRRAPVSGDATREGRPASETVIFDIAVTVAEEAA